MASVESDTSAYTGHFRKARQLTRRASEAALRGHDQQAAAEYQAEAAVREVLIDNPSLAKECANRALELSHSREVEALSAIALGLAGDSAKASHLADDLDKRYPESTIVHLDFLPMIRASIDLKANSARAIQDLEASTRCEFGQTDLNMGFAFYPVYLRGRAYLLANQGLSAVAEFQKILDHPGVVQMEPIGALAHLGMARAYALSSDNEKSKRAYQDFLSLWRNADPQLLILKRAKTEYAAIQQSGVLPAHVYP